MLSLETCGLSEEMKAESYGPSAVRRVHIPEPGRPVGTRPLGVPTVRDQVVQRVITQRDGTGSG